MNPIPRLINNGTIKVDSIHEIYYEKYGKEEYRDDIDGEENKKTTTALNLHGGPGAGSFPNHSRFFNSTLYNQIVLFDQRGCGKSTPRGETKNNTLEHLVNDIEKLRMHLSVDKWDVILGGSWGSTLALAYAQSYPDRVGGLVLRGICLFRSKEIEWLFGDRSTAFTENSEGEGEGENNQENASLTCVGDSEKVSEQWNQFKNCVNVKGKEQKSHENVDERNMKRETLHRYYDYLLGDNALDRIIAAKNWMLWEMTVSKFSVMSDVGKGLVSDAHLLIGTTSNTWLLKQIGEDGEENTLIAPFKLSSFRQWVQCSYRNARESPSPSDALLKLRPVRSQMQLPQTEIKQVQNMTDEDIQKFIPAQAMLTCFYSVNNKFMMSKFDLLSKDNIDRIRHIPCIAIQGGQDSICPPDSALDLKEVWPEMELRVVVSGKHSQYDPQITSELVKATDRIAPFNV